MGPLWGFFRSYSPREQHSADGRRYIDRIDEGKWEVVFDGDSRGVFATRKLARIEIRRLKGESRFTRELVF